MNHHLSKLTFILIILTVYACSRKVSPLSTIPVDGDGNHYGTVIIGEQEWLAENLKTTSYNDGKAIGRLGAESSDAFYCWYNNDTIYKAKYGALYSWGAVSGDKLCPQGWRIPAMSDWKVLENHLQAKEGNAVKAMASQNAWVVNGRPGTIGHQLEQNNSSGFNAMPAGSYRSKDWSFRLMGNVTFFWTTTTFKGRYTYSPLLSASRDSVGYPALIQSGAHSVRCIKE